MAYDKQKIFEQAKKAIEENNLFFIEDIVAFVPCGKTYFYDTFSIDSEEMNTIKDMLEKNKTRTKSEIRAKLLKSQKAAELLALYRLICTKEEHQLLNQSYIDHTTKGDKINNTLSVLTTDELIRRAEAVNKLENET